MHRVKAPWVPYNRSRHQNLQIPKVHHRSEHRAAPHRTSSKDFVINAAL